MNNEFFRNKVMGLVKWVLPFYLLTFLPLSVSAQKFALVDMEYILKNIPAYERANEQLSQVSKQWQAEVDALTTEAQTLYKNYQNEVVFLSKEQKKAKQDAIVEKEKQAADLKKQYFGPEGELFKKRNALMNPIQDEIYNAIKDISETSFNLPRMISSITAWPMPADVDGMTA